MGLAGERYGFNRRWQLTSWGWVVAGAILLGAELTLVNAQFYLVFIGGAAIITGLVAALAPAFTEWMQWVLFAVLVIVSIVAFRERVHNLLKARPQVPVEAGPVAGVVLTLPVHLAPGESCQAEHRGSFWTLRNDGPVALEAGAHVRIDGVEGLTLVVRPAA
jgi:membrane protein implicated in regulation of membrane protease activity